jgi:prevent-host-death family protein
MTEVSVRDLRNHGGEVIDRVARGEQLVITRDGRRVAELRPIIGRGLTASVLIERWSRLPRVEPDRVRRDVDETIDPAL